MAGRGRGKEVALQVEVESQEEWEELISKEGLTVIDVYQEWCGPCKAMLSNFRRFKNEIGDDLLKFAVAKADSVEALERYRGKCEPCFLFYAGGLLVDVIHGANSPLLQKKMVSQLAHEHKVLEGLAERKEIHDPKFPHKDDRHRAKTETLEGVEESSDESSDEEEDETRDDIGMRFGGENIMFDSLPEKVDIKKVYLEKMFTIGIIKSDVYAEGKADEITEKIREAGFDILEQMERIFAQAEVKELYSNMKNEPNFNEIIKDMCNGPSVIFVLSKGEYGEGIIDEWKEFLGPEVMAEAKEKAPKSLRAIYGKESQHDPNGFHASNSLEAAKRELNLFFPDFVVPKISIAHIRPLLKPMTIAIIRPAALQDFKDKILQKIASDSFKIEFKKEIQMTRADAEEFCVADQNEPFYEDLIMHMASGPMLVLALSYTQGNVVEAWKTRLGSSDVEKASVMEPESYRGQFTVREVNVNLFHGSDSEQMAQKEFDRFFPMEQSLVAIKPHAYHNKDAIIHKISQAGFRIVARKEVDLTPEKAKTLYQSCATKEFFNDLTSSMTQGPTTFLVLSRPNATTDWRALAGPTDPEIARNDFPHTIRALFGKDILRNAVHAPSSISAAKEEIALIFGDIQFDAEGLPKKKKKQKRRRSSAEEEEEYPLLLSESARIESAKTDDDSPAAMPHPDKFEKEGPSKDSVQKRISDTDRAAVMAAQDRKADDLDTTDLDLPGHLGAADDQEEDVKLKDVLYDRLIQEEIPPDRWGVEVEVPFEKIICPPYLEEILLEKSPEASWAEHVAEMERQAELGRQVQLQEMKTVEQVMEERQDFIDMMAEQNIIPELLAEEKWEESEKRQIEEGEKREFEEGEKREFEEGEKREFEEGEKREFEEGEKREFEEGEKREFEEGEKREFEEGETREFEEGEKREFEEGEKREFEEGEKRDFEEREKREFEEGEKRDFEEREKREFEEATMKTAEERMENDGVVKVMDERQEFIEMMADQQKVPELLAEEMLKDAEKEHFKETDSSEGIEVAPFMPEEQEAPPKQAVPVVSEELETPYPQPDDAREEVEGLPKEEDPSDLPFADELLDISFQSIDIDRSQHKHGKDFDSDHGKQKGHAEQHEERGQEHMGHDHETRGDKDEKP